jgi:hypothetical protein
MVLHWPIWFEVFSNKTGGCQDNGQVYAFASIVDASLPFVPNLARIKLAASSR